MKYNKPGICQYCGKPFVKESPTQKYCKSIHTTQCKTCGNLIEFTCSPKDRPSYCSENCRIEGRRQSCLVTYGVENVSKIDEVRKKISERNSSDDVSAKRKATCIARYGVDNVAKSEKFKEKASAVMRSEEYLRKRETTCIERYGTSSPMQNEYIKNKRRKTNEEKYGSARHFNSLEYYEKRIIDPSKVHQYLEFKKDPSSYIKTHYTCNPTIDQLKRDLGVTDTPIYKILSEYGCSDLLEKSYSSMEDSVYEFLCKLVDSSEIIRNDRTAIKPLEIDLYIPKYHLGIECNPAATHNSSIPYYNDGFPLERNYHKNKSALAVKNDIFLFHIFGYQWTNKRPIIESMLRNLLNANDCKLGARNTHVEGISYLDCKKFLDENHLQGNTASKIRLALRHNITQETLSVMTFNHVRPTLGKKTKYNENTWELSRFCSKLNTSIIGGASKLFQYFINNYNPDVVVSFSDISHTRGNLYKNLGFIEDHETSPSYVWCDIYDKIYYTRVSCQKRFLRKLLNDDSIDIENQTEREIMESHKFVRIYDCGVICWVYKIQGRVHGDGEN